MYAVGAVAIQPSSFPSGLNAQPSQTCCEGSADERGHRRNGHQRHRDAEQRDLAEIDRHQRPRGQRSRRRNYDESRCPASSRFAHPVVGELSQPSLPPNNTSASAMPPTAAKLS